jgi:hypothetical protein
VRVRVRFGGGRSCDGLSLHGSVLVLDGAIVPTTPARND